MIVNEMALKHRITVLVFMLLIVVSGAFAYKTLPREASPEIKIPFIVVTTSYRGVAPVDIENLITIKLENKLKSLSNIKEIRSTSFEGLSNIVVEFEADVDLDFAFQKVRDKVEQVKSELPKDADQPNILEINTAEFPVMLVNLSGSVGEVRLKELAEMLEDKLEAIPGVLGVEIVGGREREVRIEFDPDRMAAYNVPLSELISLVERENINSSVGSVEMKDSPSKFSLRIPGEFANADDINQLVLYTRSGKAVNLGDIAKIAPPSESFKDRSTYARLGRWIKSAPDKAPELLYAPAVTLSVQKRSGANIIEVTDAVKAKLEEEAANFPSGINPPVITVDNSYDVRMLAAELENGIMTGIILVVIVLMIVMGVRNSLLVAICIPLTMLMTFAALQLMDFRLNIVVLFSLVLSVGMLVDDAIVIVENIYRHMQEGKTKLRAALTGASEVAWPVITSTLTTLAAFFPLIFWPNLMGKFMRFLPITVIICLSASLIVAMVINPVICSFFMRLKHGKQLQNIEHAPIDLPDRNIILRGYATILRYTLNNRWRVVGLSFVCLFVLLLVYAKMDLGKELFPSTSPRRAYIDVTFPQGTKLDTTDALMVEIENRIKKYGDIKYATTNVGSQGVSLFIGKGGGQGAHIGRLSLDFKGLHERSMKSEDIIEDIRKSLRDIVGAEIKVESDKKGPASGAPITVEVFGEDFNRISEIAKDVQAKIKDIPGLVDLRDDYVEAKPEIQFRVDRSRAAHLNLSTSLISMFLKAAVNGMKVGTFRDGNDEYEIVIRLPESFRNDIAKLNSLMIPDPTGKQIPLSTVAKAEFGGGLGSINRKDQKRVIKIEANVQRDYQADKILEQVKERVKKVNVPKGYHISFAGDFKDMQEATNFLGKAFIFAIFIIGLIMVSEFNSLSLPFIILFQVLLSLIGVLLGLVVTQTPFGVIMTGVGVVSLAGVVVKNGIVMLDFVEKLRDRGLPVNEAIVKAGATRLRPVLLTAITAILGLLPMALKTSFDFRNLTLDINSESSQMWGPLSIAVIFGLSVATILTLVVVPVLYSMLNDVREKLFGKRQTHAETMEEPVKVSLEE